MYLLFVEYDERVKPLFAYDDKGIAINKYINIKDLKDQFLNLLPTARSVSKQYFYNYHFEDADRGEFYALVKIENGKVADVLRLSNDLSLINDYYELVKQENTCKERIYEVFEFKGTLDE